jgi:uridine phosphorylase
MILNEFDTDKFGILNPIEITPKIDGFPKLGVSCFSNRIIKKLVEVYKLEPIAYGKNSNFKNPIYKINYKGKDVAIFMSFVGAGACIMGYEEIIAMGLEKLVLIGSCGVLDKNIEDTTIIIPTSAIRDEGTSYHYLKASDEVEVNENHVRLIDKVLKEHGYNYINGKTWTTDAPYRETKAKMETRKKQGCICVEMECSAMAAVAKFRNVELLQFFHAADNLDATTWDKRSLGADFNLSEREKMMILGLELVVKM